MGQYYVCYLEQGNTKTIYTPGYYNKQEGEVFQGSKITEHSWIGNDFVESICAKLHNKEARVIWIGDYSKGYTFSSDDKTTPSKVEKLYRSNGYNVFITKNEFDISNKFIVNISRKEYVDVKKYMKRSIVKSGPMKDWCLHPLPLLTSVGGDQGGGDYHSNNIDFDMVGRWAYDRIMIVDNKPKGDAFLGCKELKVTFREK